jgi:hypothetical protein
VSGRIGTGSQEVLNDIFFKIEYDHVVNLHGAIGFARLKSERSVAVELTS